MASGSVQRIARSRGWRARYRAPNGREVSRSFNRKVDAEDWLTNELASTNRGDWIDPKAGAIRYREWAEVWLAGKHGLSARTRHDYEELLGSRVYPTFQDLPVNRITSVDVRRWVAEMVEDGLSGARMTKARHLLRASLQQAVTDRLILANPTANVDVLRSKVRDQRFLTPTEVTSLAEAASAHQDEAALLIRFMAYTGVRWGEAVAVRAHTVNVDQLRVGIREAQTEIAGKLGVGPPKSHESRTITMPRFVAKRFDVHMANLVDDDLVFTSPTGKSLRSSNWRRRVWHPALKDANIDPELRIHDLRHTAASLMIKAGASIKVVQRQLGHATAAMTLDVYGHLYDDELDALADVLDERFASFDIPED